MNSISNQIVQKFHKQLVNGEYTSGQRLEPEEALCKIYKTSRTSLREAMHQLKGLGVIKSIKGSGNYITEASLSPVALCLASYSALLPEDGIDEILELRISLEADNCLKLADTISHKKKLTLVTQLKSLVQELTVKNALEKQQAFFSLLHSANEGSLQVSFIKSLSAKTSEALFEGESNATLKSSIDQLSAIIIQIEQSQFQEAADLVRNYLLSKTSDV